jgi:hypothetical protein
MSTTIGWSIPTTNPPDSFNLYRAITGIVVAWPNSLVTGDQLVFAATSPDLQRVTITGTDIDTVITNINTQANGLVATELNDTDGIILRCNALIEPKLKLSACTFLTHTGIAPQIIAPQSDYVEITSVSFVADTYTYSYTDLDGDPTDWYTITSVTGGVESVQSVPLQSLLQLANLCAIEGRVTDMQNTPLAGAEVKATMMIPDDAALTNGITYQPVTTVTDEHGRWSISLLQGQLVLFEIPSIRYNQAVIIPSQSYATLAQLAPLDPWLWGWQS